MELLKTLFTPKSSVQVRSKGLTIIELLIAMAVGSLVLMMLMQMIVMTITVKRKYEYENFLTDQNLLIFEQVRKNLENLQPQRVDNQGVNGDEWIIEFKHEYDIVFDDINNIIKRVQDLGDPDQLIFNISTGQITYNGSLLHSSNVIILDTSTISLTYFEETDPLPSTCTDFDPAVPSICGDGVLEFELNMAVVFASGEIGDVYTFVTRIII